jgi:tetratricopeptide (TPR) repeat protein
LAQRLPYEWTFSREQNNLAALHFAEGKKKEAEQLYRRALSIKEKILGADHPDVAMTLNNLAVFYKSCKRYDRAESLYKRSISIFEKALGPTHPKVLISLENYAQLLRKMKRNAEALRIEARAEAVQNPER